MRAIIVILSIVLLLASRVAGATGSIAGSVEIRISQVEVIWVESRADMRELLAANNVPVTSDSERGFALRGHHAQTGADVCVVYALRPRELNDKATLVFGHEVLHCFLGDYH